MKITELKPFFCEFIPKEKEQGILYITEKYKVSIHLCACGCGIQCILPFSDKQTDQDWKMENNNGLVTFNPSIGNFKGEEPYHAHYYIKENKIIWC